MFNVRVQTFGDRTVLHCKGKLVRGHETTLLCAALRQEKPTITLDLTEVALIDAAGIGALVSLQAAGIYLELAGPTHAVREVLMRTKLDSVFEIVGPVSIREITAGAVMEAPVPA